MGISKETRRALPLLLSRISEWKHRSKVLFRRKSLRKHKPKKLFGKKFTRNRNTVVEAMNVLPLKKYDSGKEALAATQILSVLTENSTAIDKITEQENTIETTPTARGELAHRVLLPVIEVFSVQITLFGQKEPCQIQGSVEISGQGSYFPHFPIYCDKDCGTITIKKKGYLPLVGPGSVILPEEEIGFYVDLKDTDGNEMIRKLECWKVDEDRVQCDEPLTAKLEGKHGLADISFSVYYDARPAFVNFLLLINNKDGGGGGGNGKDSDSVGIYGKVAASTSMLPQKEILLFNKRKEEHVVVKNKQKIQLARSVVFVPYDYEATIKTDLWDPHGGHEIDVIFAARQNVSMCIHSMGRKYTIQVTVEFY